MARVFDSTASLSGKEISLWLLGILAMLLTSTAAMMWHRLDTQDARISATEVTEAVHGSEYKEIIRRLDKIDRKLDQ